MRHSASDYSPLSKSGWLRFHTSHLLTVVVLAAIGLGVVRHPDTLRGAAVALLGGVLVVLPTLGVAELFRQSTRDDNDVNWKGVALSIATASVGIVVASIALSALVGIFG